MTSYLILVLRVLKCIHRKEIYAFEINISVLFMSSQIKHRSWSLFLGKTLTSNVKVLHMMY